MSDYYVIRGVWDPKGEQTFFDKPFRRFLAQVPSQSESIAERVTVDVYLPEEYVEGDINPDEVHTISLSPGTYIMQYVPHTTIVGDPSSLTRSRDLFLEDLLVGGANSVTTLALPAAFTNANG